MRLAEIIRRSRAQLPTLAAHECGRLIVHVVVNVEHWPLDRAMPRGLLTTPHGVGSIPDVPNYSWYEYGMREGMPRFFRLMRDIDVGASASLNAAVIDHYPKIAAEIRDIGWEPVGHGVSQQSLHAADDEAAVIERSLEQIEQFFGARPRGWLGPGLGETEDTLWHLSEAGIEYVFDWVLTELPVWFEVTPRPVLSIPYNLEMNDSVLHAVQAQPSDEIRSRILGTLEVYDRELREGPRILTVPLHPHLLGVPHRFVHLERVLHELAERDDVVFLTGEGIFEWFVHQVPPPA